MQGDDQFHPELALGDFASQMKLEYANVAGILGMCSDMEPFYIIYEYLDQVCCYLELLMNTCLSNCFTHAHTHLPPG